MSIVSIVILLAALFLIIIFFNVLAKIRDNLKQANKIALDQLAQSKIMNDSLEVLMLETAGTQRI